MRHKTRPWFNKIKIINDKSAEQRLFESVLLLFLVDVQEDYDRFKLSINGSVEKYREKLETHRNCVTSDHVEMLCFLVGLEYSSFRRTIMDISEGKRRVDIHSIHY